MNQLEDSSFASMKSKMSSGLICGKHHDVIITEFTDKYFIIVSESGKIGTLVQISFETNAMKNSTSLCSKVLFGKDEPEAHGVAQSIVEVLNIKKPVVFGFSTKEYDSATVMEMRQLVTKNLLESDKENLAVQNIVP